MFLARMAVLLLATGALLEHGLSQALPRITGPSTPAQTTAPALTPGPGLSTSLSGRLDATGALTEDVRVVSEDGLAVLELLRETKVLDAQRQPLAAISVTLADILAASFTFARVGEGYKFEPEGATLDPPASLTINYDPHANFPFTYQDVDTRVVYLTYYGKKEPVRPPLASVGGETGSVSAKTGHLGTMVLYCDVLSYPMS
jgi:hypothetical protein